MKPIRLIFYEAASTAVVLNLFFTTPPLSACPFFQALLAINEV